MDIPQLTKGEAKVYEALSGLGESFIGDILKTSGVSHSKIYDILKRLSEKGLVSSINKNGKQCFSAAAPSNLLNLINDEKVRLKCDEERMTDIINLLNLRKNKLEPKSILSSYEGIKGLKSVLESILGSLNKNSQILIMGAPKQSEDLSGYLKGWQKRRIEIGAVCKIITDLDSPSWKDKWWTESKLRGITFTKKLKTVAPSYIVITEDSVITIFFSARILTFVVKHPDIAIRYIEFFKELWKTVH